MAFFNLYNTKIKAVAATVPDDVEYTTDYNELFGEEHVKKIYYVYRCKTPLYYT